MPIIIKTSHTDDFEKNMVILPYGKNKEDDDVIQQYTGLKYKPTLNTGAKETNIFQHPDKPLKVIVLGLGEAKDQPKSYHFYRSIIHQYKSKCDLNVEVICTHLSDDQLINAVIGLRTSLYEIGIFKTNGNKGKYQEPTIYININDAQQSIAQKGLQTAEAQLAAMHLVDMPSNHKTPEFLADYAIESGKKYGYDVSILGLKQLEDLKMEALLAVGQGSVNEPKLIVMEYKPDGMTSQHPALGLVGKGITFDTGGISIKPANNMGYMKSDMGGAAAVIGAIELAARLKLNIHIVGVVPSAENSVDANSIRPGDVIGSYSGKTIEVLNTDAEGRLVLADGLAYIVDNYQPEYLIDLATLTGSIIAALGYTTSGLFTNNEAMADALTQIGESINERVWRMPMWEDYVPELQSDIADVKNLSMKPVAGSITAAKFLEVFTSDHTRWAHLDIAGVAFADSEYAKLRTATAYGVRLLTSYMESLIK